MLFFFKIYLILSKVFNLILRVVGNVSNKVLVEKAVSIKKVKMFSQSQIIDQDIHCEVCKTGIIFQDSFRLYDSDMNNSQGPRYYYRNDPCYKCVEQFKIEFCTETGVWKLSGAKGYHFGKNRFEGFYIEDFIMECVTCNTKKYLIE